MRLRHLASGLVCVASCAAAPRIGALRSAADTVPRYARFELSFELEATFDNPDDPAQVDVVAEFRGPDGRAVTVPAFCYLPYQRGDDGSLEPAGEPQWQVRFAPREVGAYAYRVKARDRTGETVSPAGRLTCTPSDLDGFVRVSKRNPRYLELASGQPYLALGFNLFSFARLGRLRPDGRLDELAGYLNKLADAGGNFVRLRMDSWWLAIEMTADERQGYRGIGRYEPRNCWEVDQLFELAERRGVHIMLCLWNANNTVNDPPATGRNGWRRAYNLFLTENGGPCETADRIWTDETARELARRKLRYAVARWGYSRNLMSWEFFNEVSCRPATIDDAAAWHRDMARYLRSIDPWEHPITTSIMGDAALFDRFWELPEMEIAQKHVYRYPDIAAAMGEMMVRAEADWPKPFLFGEFGVGPLPGGEGKYDFDPEGVHHHNGLWGPIAAGSAGAGAFWYIGSYLDKYGLYPQYASLAKWAADVPWTDPALHPLEVRRLSYRTPPQDVHPIDYALPTSTRWAFKLPPEDRFEIGRTGQVSNAGSLRPHLYVSRGRKKPPTFVLDAPRPFQFVVRVDNSVGNDQNALLADLDGERVGAFPFPAGKEHGVKQHYIEQYDNWVSTYQQEAIIDIPAGRHELRLEAVGKDRLEVGYILRGYLTFEEAEPLRLRGQATQEAAFFWIQNRRSTWSALAARLEPIPVRGMEADLGGLRDGEYELEWWDTWAGKVAGRETVRCDGGQVTFAVPEVTRDIAGKLRRR